MKILIIITTYRRPEKLYAMLKDIYRNRSSFELELVIYEDYSDADYSRCKSYLKRYLPNFTWRKADHHYGKENYWMWITELYQEVRRRSFDYVIQWPDDQLLTKNAIARAVEIWEQIPDPHKICLTLSQHIKLRTQQWTPYTMKLVDFGNMKVYQSGWVDMNFIAERRFFDELEYQVRPIDRNVYNFSSSGVGMYISRTLFYRGFTFWQVAKSLTIHTAGFHGSQMHPEERKNHPGITNHEPVVASMATIPGREQSLQRVVNSILPQVDELHIYLNDFDEVPGFLEDSKIHTYLSKNHSGDLGDAGKFYNARQVKGYHFTIDDDIIYPGDYVSTMITAIEKYNRQCVISTHGRIFGKMPVRSYYHGHTEAFRALGDVSRDARVHVVGTGALAYHSDTCDISLSAFETMNMADIWLSKYCNDKGIPMVVIAHKTGWLKDSGHYDKNYSIYRFCHRNDDVQTQVVNETEWRSLPVL